DVSFEVCRGQVFGYIGPNGAGKTTSMRILATLDLPTAGDAFVDGFSCVNDPDRVRRRLGFMPDYFGTYADVDCYEYLDFFARSPRMAKPCWSARTFSPSWPRCATRLASSSAARCWRSARWPKSSGSKRRTAP